MVKISDIAKELGVSISTVSRALNNKKDISKEMKNRILDKAKEMNYVTNINAKKLASKNSNSIGVFLFSRDKFKFQENTAMKYIETFLDEAKKSNYDIHLFSTDKDSSNERSILDLCLERSIDGAIVIGSTKEDNYFSDFDFNKIPVVFMEKELDVNDKGVTIITDNRDAIKIGIKYLMDLNHTKIAFLGETNQGGLADLRYKIYVKEMKKYNLFRDEFIFHGNFSIESGRKVAAQIKSMENPPTAVFSSSDMMAIGLIKGLHECGLNVPEDISVLGFDGFEIGKYIHPGLTTIKQDFYGMATKAMECLFTLIDEKEVPKEVYFLPKLLIRDSCHAL